MKKNFLILSVLLVTSLVLTSCGNLQTRNISKHEEEKIISTAIDYFQKKYPEFNTEKNNTYVAQNKKSKKWYVYLFDKRDKGLGYEVYYDNGIITDNFNSNLFAKRLELIEYMNKLMPENKQYNEYVGFNPYGSNKAKSYTAFGVNDGRVEYVVVSKNIDMKKQLEIDYLILKKSNELLKDLQQRPNGNWVKYFQTDETNIDVYTNKNISSYQFLRTRLQRSLLTAEFLDKAVGMNCISEYAIGGDGYNRENSDKKREEILSSLENYRQKLKLGIISSKKSSKEKNKLLLEELLTPEEKKEQAKKIEEKRLKTNSKVNEKYILKMKKEGAFYDIKFSPDQKQVAIINDYGKKISILDVETGETIRTLATKQKISFYNDIRSISYSPDGKYIAGGNVNEVIEIWDVASGEIIKTIKGHQGKIYKVAYSPDGKYITSVAEPGELKIWDAKTGKNLKTLKQNQQYTLCYSPDGKYLATGNKIFDTETWNLVKTLDNVKEIITYSPDGKYIVIGEQNLNEEVKILNLETGAIVTTLKGHTQLIHSVCYSPNGKYIATASNDESVKIWNSTTGQLVDTLEEDATSYALSAIYSPNGKKLVVSWMKGMAFYNVE